MFAVLAIGGTIIANMVVKVGISLVYGGKKGVPAAIAIGFTRL